MGHSWLRFPGLLGVFVLMMALAAPAQADVDWSQYIDRDAKPTPRDGSFANAPAKAQTTRPTRARPAKKKVAKAKVKARSKAKRARRK